MEKKWKLLFRGFRVSNLRTTVSALGVSGLQNLGVTFDLSVLDFRVFGGLFNREGGQSKPEFGFQGRI